MVIWVVYFASIIGCIGNIISDDITCTTVTGEPSVDISEIHCDAEYTLVSCGFNSSDTRYYAGTFIANDSCYAKSTYISVYVTAIGLCCDFRSISVGNDHCLDVRSNVSTDDYNSYTSITCPFNYNMVGCQFYNPQFGSDNNGGCVSNTDDGCEVSIGKEVDVEYCIAVDGVKNAAGVIANARCCEMSDYITTCTSVWSEPTNMETRISCPNNYYMFNCIGYSKEGYKYLEGWWIENNECVVKSSNGEHNPGMYAIGTCCQMLSLNPTINPTNLPTVNPTSLVTTTIPTHYPIVTISSEYPTLNPTAAPVANEDPNNTQRDHRNYVILFKILGVSIFIVCVLAAILYILRSKKSNPEKRGLIMSVVGAPYLT